MRLTIIVPAFNEGQTIGTVLEDLQNEKPKKISTEIVVVNDGSEDNTAQEVRKKRVTLINHFINRGLGAALGTGFSYAKAKNSDFVITFDADSQHRASDVKKMLAPLINDEADMVIGSRLLSDSTMPLDRRFMNHFANLFNSLLWSIWVTDTQSGLRAFNKEAIAKINIRTNKMEVSSELLKEAKIHKLRIKEIPIEAIYTNYSRTKGQKNSNAINIATKLLIYKLIKY